MEYTLNTDETAFIASKLRFFGRESTVLYRFYETLLNDPQATDDIKRDCLEFFAYSVISPGVYVDEAPINNQVIDTLVNFIISSNEKGLVSKAFTYLDAVIPPKELKVRLAGKDRLLTILELKRSGMTSNGYPKPDDRSPI